MDYENLHSESLKWMVRDVAPKIEGMTAALDRISSDIKWLEGWLNKSGIRVETEVVYWLAPLSDDPKAAFRPDQGRIIAPPQPRTTATESPRTEPPGNRPDVEPAVVAQFVGNAVRNLQLQSQRERRVSRRFYAVAWAPMPDGRWRLQFREYREEGIAYLDEATGEFFEDEVMDGPADQLSLRPLIETTASVRFQVGTNQVLERLLVKVKELIPDYGPSDMLRGLGVV
jgi:hypothetical protein